MPSIDTDYLRTTLLHEYAGATKHYAWAVGELDRQRPHLPKERYDLMYRMVEDARKDCERLRNDLAQVRDWIMPPPMGTTKRLQVLCEEHGQALGLSFAKKTRLLICHYATTRS